MAGDSGSAAQESPDDWLRGEAELAGRITVAGSLPREGEPGAPAEALVVAVGSGGVLAVLAKGVSEGRVEELLGQVLDQVVNG